MSTPIVPPIKRCKKCEQELPATAEFFYVRKGGTLAPRCKVCVRADSQAYRERNPNYNRDYYHENREQEKKRSNAYRRANRDHVIEYSRQWRAKNPNYRSEYYQRNKTHELARVKAYRAARVEWLREYWKRYRQEHPEAAKQAQQRYREKHPERVKSAQQQWRESNQDYDRERSRQWHRRNPEKGRIVRLRRRTRKLALPDTLTQVQWRYCLDYFNHRCVACGRHQGLWHRIVPDHWLALSKGGATEAANIIPLCNSIKDGSGGCNNSKGDTDAAEWLERRFGATKAAEILARVQAYFDSL